MRTVAGHHFVQHHADRPEVVAHSRLALGETLRGCVMWRQTDDRRPRAGRFEAFGGAEVEHLDRAVFHYKHVFGFQVRVHHGLVRRVGQGEAVQLLQHHTDGASEANRLRRGHRLRQAFERRHRHEFHGDVKVAIGFADFVNVGDHSVRAAKRLLQLRATPFGVDQPLLAIGVNEFQGDGRRAVACFVDGSRVSLAESSTHGVSADHGALSGHVARPRSYRLGADGPNPRPRLPGHLRCSPRTHWM